jgi:hypothetical protein
MRRVLMIDGSFFIYQFHSDVLFTKSCVQLWLWAGVAHLQQITRWRSKKLFFLAGCILGEGPGWGARLFYFADSAQSGAGFQPVDPYRLMGAGCPLEKPAGNETGSCSMSIPTVAPWIAMGSALTVTVVFTLATGRVTLSPSNIPSRTLRVLLKVRKPSDLTAITYCPVANLAWLHSPDWLVDPVIFPLPDLSSRVISALGITAPFWSMTVS